MSSTPNPPGPDKLQEAAPRKGALYADSTEGLKGVNDDFQYWTGKLTDSSFQLSLALIGANWAVFGSVARILNNAYSRGSLGLVLVSLTVNLLGAQWMAELLRRRVNYASGDTARWQHECSAALGRVDPWPFTKEIEQLGSVMRWTKTWLPLVAGALFLVALGTA